MSFPELCQTISLRLPYLGINDYFVVSYNNGDPRRAELLAARTQEREFPPLLDSQFDAQALLPRTLLPLIGGGKAFVVLPVAHKTEVLGRALFGLELERALAYDPIANAIGAGIRAARLAERTSFLARSQFRIERNSAVHFVDTPSHIDAEDQGILDFPER